MVTRRQLKLWMKGNSAVLPPCTVSVDITMEN